MLCNTSKDFQELCKYEEIFEMVPYHPTSKDQIFSDLANKYDKIDAIYAGWAGLAPFTKFDKQLVDWIEKHNKRKLKIVSFASVGYDGHDLQYLKDKSIHLTNVPSFASKSCEDVADTALYLTLNTFRDFNLFSSKIRQYKNTALTRKELHFNVDLEGTEFPFGHFANGKEINSPKDKNCCILGFGEIGKAIARRCNALGMNIHYYKSKPIENLRIESNNLNFPIQYHSQIRSLMECCDLLVLCVPGTKANHHLVNNELLDMCTKPIRIVNVGRGNVIDEKQLVENLDNGRVLSCGLDVFEKEPFIERDLLNRNDAFLLPHVGSSTTEIFDISTVIALEQIKQAVIDLKVPEFTVN